MNTASMSVPPPTSSIAPPRAGSAPREFTIPLEAQGGWKRRGRQDALRLSPLGAVIEHEKMLREPLRVPLGTLQIGLLESGSAEAMGRFPILRRLSATTVLPREHGIEGWLWTRPGGSAMTVLGDPEVAPNAGLLFTKPLGAGPIAAFAPAALAEIAARSPLGAPAVHGLLFRVENRSNAEAVFRQFGLLRPLTDREVPPALRRSLPDDRPADPALLGGDEARSTTSVAPPGRG
jgi:hypothetical protein